MKLMGNMCTGHSPQRGPLRMMLVSSLSLSSLSVWRPSLAGPAPAPSAIGSGGSLVRSEEKLTSEMSTSEGYSRSSPSRRTFNRHCGLE